MLVLPIYYADLFAEKEGVVLEKSSTGFRDSRSGKTKHAYFPDLAYGEVHRIESFIAAYQRLVILSLNDHIEDHFTDDLDSCIALDYNLAEHDKRTEIGELEYKAKYSQDPAAIDALVSEMAQALHRIPKPRHAWRCLLTYVPPQPGKRFHLPKIIAERLASHSGIGMFVLATDPLVHAELACAKPSFKNLPLSQKIQALSTLMSPAQVRLSKPVTNANVIVIDDLYQSGATLWSFARCLKSMGASSVHGVACVKSWRDTDNQ
jgi:hypothetical protein